MLQILPKFCPRKGPKVTGKRFAVVWQEADPALSPPGKVLAAKGAVKLPHSGAQHLPSTPDPVFAAINTSTLGNVLPHLNFQVTTKFSTRERMLFSKFRN